MHWFSDRWVHAVHWQEVFALGARAAEALADPVQEATQLNYLAWVHGIPLNDPKGALRHATRALDLATRSEATAQVAWAHNYMGVALRRLRRFEEAIAATTRAADAFKTLGDADAQVACVSSVGHCLREAGRPAEAAERYREALAIAEDESSGVTPGIAAHLRPHFMADLGWCLGQLGRRDEAIATLTEATGLMEAYDANYLHGRALEILARLQAEQGQARESTLTYQRAADVFEAVGDIEALRRCRGLSGETA
jgi:tetratricopeptide (TPR) repeat protein